MKINLIKENKNILLKRREILAEADYEGKSTPSITELQELVSKQFKSNIENTEVSKIVSDFGRASGKVWIKIWDEKKIEKQEKKKEAKKE